MDSVGALAKKGRPTTIVVSAYTLVKKEDLPQRGLGLLQSSTTSVEASIVNTICQLLQEGWRDVCECGYLGVLDFCFRDDCWRTKMNSETRIDGDKSGEERDFKHFRMQELNCVDSKSRIGSGEREIQLAQFRMQDFHSKSKKSSMD